MEKYKKKYIIQIINNAYYISLEQFNKMVLKYDWCK